MANLRQPEIDETSSTVVVQECAPSIPVKGVKAGVAPSPTNVGTMNENENGSTELTMLPQRITDHVADAELIEQARMSSTYSEAPSSQGKYGSSHDSGAFQKLHDV